MAHNPDIKKDCMTTQKLKIKMFARQKHHTDISLTHPSERQKLESWIMSKTGKDMEAEESRFNC